MTKTPVSVFLGALFSIATSTAVLADQGGTYGYGRGWDGGMHGGAYGWFMAPMFLIFMVVLVIAAVLVFRWIAGPAHHGHSSGKTALDILSERFARGEIDKAEFEERRSALER
ncbi:MAG: SHOCT domain-containing protein [Alphaproteobacteria bacterium]